MKIKHIIGLAVAGVLSTITAQAQYDATAYVALNDSLEASFAAKDFAAVNAAKADAANYNIIKGMVDAVEAGEYNSDEEGTNRPLWVFLYSDSTLARDLCDYIWASNVPESSMSYLSASQYRSMTLGYMTDAQAASTGHLSRVVARVRPWTDDAAKLNYWTRLMTPSIGKGKADSRHIGLFTEYRAMLPDAAQKLSVTAQEKNGLLDVAERNDEQNAYLRKLSADLMAYKLDQ